MRRETDRGMHAAARLAEHEQDLVSVRPDFEHVRVAGRFRLNGSLRFSGHGGSFLRFKFLQTDIRAKGLAAVLRDKQRVTDGAAILAGLALLPLLYRQAATSFLIKMTRLAVQPF